MEQLWKVEVKQYPHSRRLVWLGMVIDRGRDANSFQLVVVLFVVFMTNNSDKSESPGSPENPDTLRKMAAALSIWIHKPPFMVPFQGLDVFDFAHYFHSVQLPF